MQSRTAKPKRFKWTVEFEVDETWVADGFDLTDERAHAMLNNDLQFAHGHELRARVVGYPPAIEVAKAQGFKDSIEVAQAQRREDESLTHDRPTHQGRSRHDRIR